MQASHGSPKGEPVTPPAPTAKPSLEPIRDEDLGEFCAFLNEHLNPTILATNWADAFRQRWGVTKPNNGFLMRDKNGRIVGGIGAIYAERTIRGRPERFCNITSWCVLEPYRSHRPPPGDGSGLAAGVPLHRPEPDARGGGFAPLPQIQGYGWAGDSDAQSPNLVPGRASPE